MKDSLINHAGLGLAAAGTAINYAGLDVLLQDIAYIVGIVASIYTLYINNKKSKEQPPKEGGK